MIHVLNKETIDKIAAGEVIERPESVVKELLDNAVDAGASAISLEIREGGLSLIRVTDNGCGIAKEDIPTAFLRHATSKLEQASDLFHIRTMGFRGEALASICGVSQVELITKQKDALYGSRYRIEGGKPEGLTEIGAPEGTSIIVRNLFYNVPVRKRFLKSKTTEASYIADIAEKTALSHPALSFSLLADGKTLLHTSGNGRLRDVIYTIYGRDVAKDLLELSFETGGIQISGWIGKPVIARAKRDFEVYFVNGRYIRSSVVERAIEDAYAPFMMQHRFPFVVLNLDIAPERVDVNVHPKKMEVRFSDNKAIYDAVSEAIRARLKQEELIIDALLEQETEGEKPVRTAFGNANVPLPGETIAEPFEQKRDARLSQKADASLQVSGKALGDAAACASYEREVPSGFPAESKSGQRTAPVLKNAAAAFGEGALLQSTEGAKQAIDASLHAETTAECSKEEANCNKPDAALCDAIPKGAAVHAASDASLSETMPDIEAAINAHSGIREQTAAADTPLMGNALAMQRPAKPEQLELDTERFLSPSAKPYFKMIGQVFDTYWIIEYKDSMYLIDQHAAHEKVNYERFMKLISERKVESQMILPPILLTLSLREAELLEKYLPVFEELGYEIEPGGGRDYLVRGVPSNLPGVADQNLLLELIDSLTDEHVPKSPERVREKVASMSCKAAVKGNRKLSEPEMKALIEALLQLDNPYACPHGRPTIAKWTKYELDKIFKRIV